MPLNDLPFSSQALRCRLLTYPQPRRYLVGFSGGADSTALLHALKAEQAHLAAGIEAIHFDHGLHPDSGSWARHCKEFCSARSIPLTCQPLDLSNQVTNLENRARELRYRFLEDNIDEHTLFLTAHNADDRAETFLLHALRGSGLEGLASIPEVRPLGRGSVARPLLEFSRESLKAYVESEGLGWIEDPSNQDTALDRNFVRLEVFPLLESRWPAARATLARTARRMRQAGMALDRLVAGQAQLDRYDELSLPLRALHSLGEDAASLVLRSWLRRQDAPTLPEARLEEFLAQLSVAAPDARCEAAWAGWRLRLFQQALCLIPPGECPACPELEWDCSSSLELGQELGKVAMHCASTPPPGRWTIGPRRAGEVIRLRADGPHRKLKKIFQEQAIPPWQRASIPVLHRDGEVMAIGDWLLSAEFRAWLDEHSCHYRWEPQNPGLRRTRLRCIGGQAHGGPA